MSALSNESSSQEVCAEETLLFSAIAQRFKTDKAEEKVSKVTKAHERNFHECTVE